MRDEVSFPHYVAGVVNDDGHDRYPRLHRQVEAALLEPAESRGRHPRALGGDRDRNARVQLLDRGAQRFSSLRGIASVDIGDVEDLPEEGEPRVVFEFALGDGGDVTSQNRGDDDGIRAALVVEHEDGRPRGPRVLGPCHVQIDAGDRQGDVRGDGGGDVGARSAAAGQQPEPEAESGAGEDGAERSRAAHRRGDVGAALGPLELQCLPAHLGGVAGECIVGIDCKGVPDGFEEGHVLAAVGIAEADGQVETFAVGVVDDGLGLARAPQ